MAAAGLKDILYYSAARLSARPSARFFALRRGPRCFGKSRTRFAGLQECHEGRERRPNKGREEGKGERSQTVKLAWRARDEGLITTLEEYLHTMVCVFHPRPSFVRSPLAVQIPVFPFLRSFAPFCVPHLVHSLRRLFSGTLRPSDFYLTIFNMSFVSDYLS